MADPDKGWQLPTVVLPEDSWCYRINIPKDIAYLRALRGAIGDMTYHWNWQRDENDTAAQVARIMNDRMLEAEDLLTSGDCEMPTCEQIIECIMTDNAVRTAIQQAITGLDGVAGDPARFTQEAYPVVANCDKDTIYGYSKALWEFINKRTIDVLQKIDEAGNAAASVDEILGLIPGFDATPISSALAWIGDLGEYSLDVYNAELTVELEQDIICDIFCLAVNGNCHVNFEQVFDYFVEKTGGTNLPTAVATFAEFVLFMVTGNWINDRVVYLWSAFQLACAFCGAEFLGINTIQPYALAAQSGNPDSDWMLYCDCATQICFDMSDLTNLTIYDGSQDNTFGNPLPSIIRGTIANRTIFPYYSSATAENAWGMAVVYDFGTTVNIEGMSFDWYCDFVTETTVNFVQRRFQMYDATQNLLWEGHISDSNTPAWREFKTLHQEAGVQYVAFIMWVFTDSEYVSGDFWLDNACVTYE